MGERSGSSEGAVYLGEQFIWRAQNLRGGLLETWLQLDSEREGVCVGSPSAMPALPALHWG